MELLTNNVFMCCITAILLVLITAIGINVHAYLSSHVIHVRADYLNLSRELSETNQKYYELYLQVEKLEKKYKKKVKG